MYRWIQNIPSPSSLHDRRTQVGFFSLGRFASRFPGFRGRVVALTEIFCCSNQREGKSRSKGRSSQPPYAIHTSGHRKGQAVLGLSSGVTNYFSYLCETYKSEPDDTVYKFLLSLLTASLRDLVGPLTAGAQVVIFFCNALMSGPGSSARRDKKAPRDLCLSVVPSLLHELVR